MNLFAKLALVGSASSMLRGRVLHDVLLAEDGEATNLAIDRRVGPGHGQDVGVERPEEVALQGSGIGTNGAAQSANKAARRTETNEQKKLQVLKSCELNAEEEDATIRATNIELLSKFPVARLIVLTACNRHGVNENVWQYKIRLW